MNDIVIRTEDVSKKFCKALKGSMFYGMIDIAKGMLGFSNNTDVLRKDEFWAVQDVSFEVNQGEVLGIIGPNGSGKTTLLKMINGIFMPDKGRIEVNGRVGALIEVGAGFHPLLTGRENIYVNGAILGMSKKEIDRKFTSIIEFADIGDFLDTPVKYYSSGMYVRLGFAVAIHSRPDILLIDEVLAVGDSEFQAKCMNAIETLKDIGTSIILVSHNDVLIERNCSRILLLNNGEAQFLGETEDALKLYNNIINSSRQKNIIQVSDNQMLLIELEQQENETFTDKMFVGFVYRSGNKICSLVAEIRENHIKDNKIVISFDVSILENGIYHLTYRVRDKHDHNRIITLQQKNYFEISGKNQCEYIGKYESSGIVIFGNQ
jgi:ABC-type polysaccharide/polyol phosphate transport system ATPase subunit